MESRGPRGQSRRVIESSTGGFAKNTSRFSEETAKIQKAGARALNSCRAARAGIFRRRRENLRDMAHRAMSAEQGRMSSAGRGRRRKAPSISRSSAPPLPACPSAHPAALQRAQRRRNPTGAAVRPRQGPAAPYRAPAGVRHQAVAAAPARAPPPGMRKSRAVRRSGIRSRHPPRRRPRARPQQSTARGGRVILEFDTGTPPSKNQNSTFHG